MTHDLVRRVETLGQSRVLVVGDLMLDRDQPPRPDGAAGVALIARAMGAEVGLIGVVGRDAEAVFLRKALSDAGVDDRLVVALNDRPTTRRGDDQGACASCPLPTEVEARFRQELPGAVAASDVVLIADEGQGVCTPSLVRGLITAARSLGIRAIAHPSGGDASDAYQGIHGLTLNREDAQRVSGVTIAAPADALVAGRKVLRGLKAECVVVTLDRDGMAVAQSDGRGRLLSARSRPVHNATGAGGMVAATIGLCLAAGGGYEEAATLANAAAGLFVGWTGPAPLTRQDILRDWLGQGRREPGKRFDRGSLRDEVRRRREAGQKVVFTDGDFDRLRPGDVRRLLQAAALGDYLVVGVHSDASVRRLKGPGHPTLAENARAEVVAALGCVDAVTLFDEDTPTELIHALGPDILVKGGDDRPDEVVLRVEGKSLTIHGAQPGLAPTLRRNTTTSRTEPGPAE